MNQAPPALRRLLFATLTVVVFLPLIFSMLLASCSSSPKIDEHPHPSPVVEFAPAAPLLEAVGVDQVLYHIDPTQSEARYAVQEVILQTAKGRLVTGRTPAVRGEILIDTANPANSQVGEIIVDVSLLQSDSNLRDRRLQSQYLESKQYPTARFIPAERLNLPNMVETGQPYAFQIKGFLTVKETTAETTWNVSLTLEEGRLRGSAEATILMSTFEVGPIDLVGFIQTEDEMTLAIDFVATPTQRQLAQRVAERGSVKPAPYTGEGIEFNRHIRPILEEQCVSCHNEGQIGHAIYPLDNVQDAVNIAPDIVELAESGYMPPWPPGGDMPPIKFARILTPAQIASLKAWAEAGAPVDGDVNAPLEAKPTDVVTIREDLRLTIPEPYRPPGDVTDDYRCFLLDPQLDRPQFMTGYEILPENLSIAHHVLIHIVSSDAREEALLLDAQDETPGWECFGGTGLATGELRGIVPSWVPGMTAQRFPENTGALLQPGDLFIFEMHYNLEAGTAFDQTSFAVELEEGNDTTIPLASIALIAPVEIPCPAAYRGTEACTREQAIAEAERLSPTAGWEADIFLAMCNRWPWEFKDQDASHVVSTCETISPISGQVIQADGHMHKLGKSTRIDINPDTPEAQVALDIPHWDFDWQGTYTLEKPLRLEAGDRLQITCVWDNTRGRQAPAAPPQNAQSHFLEPLLGVQPAYAHDEVNTSPFRYVTWGEGTSSEMCLNSMIVIPDEAYRGVVITGDEGLGLGFLFRLLLVRMSHAPVLSAVIIIALLLLPVGLVWWVRKHRRSKR